MHERESLPLEDQAVARNLVLTTYSVKKAYQEYCESIGATVSGRLREFMLEELKQSGWKV